MTQRYESQFTTSDRSEIFFQQWKVESPRGIVLITHGLGEHSDCYSELAHSLNKDHWDVFSWDLRGHGKSSGKRGYVADFDNFLLDFKALNKILSQRQLIEINKPKVFFGHSLGGLITLKALIMDDMGALAVCLSAPALGLAKCPPRIKTLVAHIAARYLPKITLWNEIHYDQLTSDENHLKSYGNDPLRHEQISPCLYLGMVEGFDYVHEKLPEIRTPLFFQVPGEDTIINSTRCFDLYKKLDPERCKIKLYPNSRHEIFNDLDKEKAFEDLKSFINPLSPHKDS